ncbi:MAG: hypothetical protein HRU19_14540 [Pseudobacteriovorax sp.]|nr:hypothetical protein [Pseudobacteriovorax sp.]
MKKIIMTTLFMMCGNVFAGNVTGKVKEIQVIANGEFIVKVDGTYNANPCNSDYFIFSKASDNDPKMSLSVLMMAYAKGDKVTISGNGSCYRPAPGWGAYEQAAWTKVNQ